MRLCGYKLFSSPMNTPIFTPKHAPYLCVNSWLDFSSFMWVHHRYLACQFMYQLENKNISFRLPYSCHIHVVSLSYRLFYYHVLFQNFSWFNFYIIKKKKKKQTEQQTIKTKQKKTVGGIQNPESKPDQGKRSEESSLHRLMR